MSSFNPKTIFDKFLSESGYSYKISDEKLSEIYTDNPYYDEIKGLQIRKAIMPLLNEISRNEIIKNKTEEIKNKLSPTIQHDDVTQIVKDLIAHAAIFKGTIRLLLETGGKVEASVIQNEILKDLTNAGIMAIIDKFSPPIKEE